MDDNNEHTPKRRRKPSPFYQANDAGGYGNPPVSGQKRKGDPGGPGRPKGQTSIEAALRRALRRKRSVVRNGNVELLHPSDILAERILEAVLAKNPTPTMIELGRRLMAKYGPPMPEEAAGGSSEGFSYNEMSILAALVTRYTRESPSETKTSPIGTVHEPYPQGEFRIFRRDDGHIGLERIEPGDGDEDLVIDYATLV